MSSYKFSKIFNILGGEFFVGVGLGTIQFHTKRTHKSILRDIEKEKMKMFTHCELLIESALCQCQSTITNNMKDEENTRKW